MLLIVNDIEFDILSYSLGYNMDSSNYTEFRIYFLNDVQVRNDIVENFYLGSKKELPIIIVENDHDHLAGICCILYKYKYSPSIDSTIDHYYINIQSKYITNGLYYYRNWKIKALLDD
jgi:hypothetical protein